MWNDLAGGDGDYCAILVAFNSILQMILYAPFAIFYINVVTPPQSAFSPVDVSYSIVAQSVAVFLGIVPPSSISHIMIPVLQTHSFILLITRHPPGRRSGLPPPLPQTPRPPKIQNSFHPDHRPTLPPRSPLHNNNPLRLTRPQRSQPNHSRPACLCPANRLLRVDLQRHIICVSTFRNGIWIGECAEFYGRE